MPMLKEQKQKQPLWKENDYKAQKKGVRHTVYSVNGDQYTGEWLDNLKDGKGTYKWKENGAIYDGDWKRGKRNGFGTYSMPDGKGGFKKEYSGGWKNDMKHGYGTNFYTDKEYYEGEWYADKRSGWGRMYFADGTIYEGEWYDDKRNGQGMLRLKLLFHSLVDANFHIFEGGGKDILARIACPHPWGKHIVARICCPPPRGRGIRANENRYEGSWRDDKKNGPGKYYYLTHGQIYEGVWNDDIAKCGTMKDFSRDSAPEPTVYPIPKVELASTETVLQEAEEMFLQEQE